MSIVYVMVKYKGAKYVEIRERSRKLESRQLGDSLGMALGLLVDDELGWTGSVEVADRTIVELLGLDFGDVLA
jgi:hypothetical protein